MFSKISIQSLICCGVAIAFAGYTQSVYASNQVSKQQQKNSQQKIIGGIQSEKDDYPFMTALTSANDTRILPTCGGAYIGERYVLTAAHCVDGVLAEDLDVWIGGHDITNPNEGQRIAVAQIYIHEDYDVASSNNDMAVLELSEVVTGITPLSLITPEIETLITEGVMMRIMGWGNTDTSAEFGDYPDILRETDVPLYNREACQTAYQQDGVNTITEQMMCAGYVEGGQDTCQGDSGGPMIYNHEGQWYHTGVVSFGNGCAVANNPGIYARVSQFINWVDQKKEGVSYQQRINLGFVEADYSDTQNISITNISDSTFTVGQTLISEEINLLNLNVGTNTCIGAALEAGDSCTISIETTPISTGDSSFTLTALTDTPLSTPVEVSFTLSAMAESNLDMPSLVESNESLVSWFSGGDSIWEANTTQIAQGDSSVSSGDVDDFESSILLATINNPRARAVSFQYLVSSEQDYDFLNVTLNGQSVLSTSGTSNTTFRTLNVDLDANREVNRIAFSFDKDQSIDGGDDKAYIDAVTVDVENENPVVALSNTAITAEESTQFTINADGSSDPDNDALSYAWAVVGSANASISSPNASSTTVTAPAFSNAQSFTLRVTVTDSFGGTSTGDVAVTVTQSATTTTPVVTPTPSSGGGGGSLGIFTSLFLAIITFVRVRHARVHTDASKQKAAL